MFNFNLTFYLIQNRLTLLKDNPQFNIQIKMTKLACQLIFLLIVLFQCFALKIHWQRQQKESMSIMQINKRQHNYANLEETNQVSQSKSIQYLNRCKEICLEMHQFFPFQFKYHRLVYRQTEGEMKYITGECFYAFRNKSSQHSADKDEKTQNMKQFKDQRKWYNWNKLKQFVDMSFVEDATSLQQKKAWASYAEDCQDESLKLSESSRIELKLSIVHSDFEYKENEGFKNLQPFDDFDQLLSGLQGASM